MGSCYSVRLAVKFKNKQKAVKVLQDFINNPVNSWSGGDIDFSLPHHAQEGVYPNDWDGLVRIFLAHWKGQEVTFGEWRSANGNKLHKRDKDGYALATNSFTASYSWETVMMEMFEKIAPYLKVGSSMLIDCDDGYDELIVDKNGHYKQIH